MEINIIIKAMFYAMRRRLLLKGRYKNVKTVYCSFPALTTKSLNKLMQYFPKKYLYILKLLNILHVVPFKGKSSQTLVPKVTSPLSPQTSSSLQQNRSFLRPPEQTSLLAHLITFWANLLPDVRMIYQLTLSTHTKRFENRILDNFFGISLGVIDFQKICLTSLARLYGWPLLKSKRNREAFLFWNTDLNLFLS